MARAAAHILLVEDDAPLRAVVAEVLRDDGYTVEEAADGRAALAAMRSAPDAVVLDLHLPYLDGPAFVQRLRHHRLWSRVPLLVLSGAGRAEDAAERLGAAALVRKPFTLDELLGAVYRVSHAGRAGA
jgi:DNA-binding response OmpR family regulator